MQIPEENLQDKENEDAFGIIRDYRRTNFMKKRYAFY